MKNLALNESQLTEFAKSVELVASRFLEGFHSAARGGEGVEFHSYLPYVEGEDVRRIDWRRLAQSDRLFVRKFEREEKLGWSLLVDASSSMKFEDKSDLARLWPAAICFLASLWGDRWSLYPDVQGGLHEAYRALLNGEAAMDPAQFSKIEAQPKTKLLVFSDFFFDLESIEKVADFWKEEFLSLHFVQILSPTEMSFNFREIIEFEDLESDEKLLLDAGSVRSNYLKELQLLQDRLRNLVGPSGSFHVCEARLDKLPDQLAEFFGVS